MGNDWRFLPGKTNPEHSMLIIMVPLGITEGQEKDAKIWATSLGEQTTGLGSVTFLKLTTTELSFILTLESISSESRSHVLKSLGRRLAATLNRHVAVRG